MENEQFAKRLRQEREKRGLTQRELAEWCGFDTSQISRYELGSRTPAGKALSKLSEALGLSIDYLMGLTDNPTGQRMAMELDPPERELVEIFRREGWPGVFRLGAERITR